VKLIATPIVLCPEGLNASGVDESPAAERCRVATLVGLCSVNSSASTRSLGQVPICTSFRTPIWLSCAGVSPTVRVMARLVNGRTASDMPGLDIAEQKSWQNYLNAALRMYAVLNVRMLEKHQLPLSDVRLLHVLNTFFDGTARMGELAEALPAPGSRLTRQTRRLEARGFLRRGASLGDRRGVVATITDEGRAAADETAVSYAEEVRKNFIDRLSRSQIAAVENGCGRITAALKMPGPLINPDCRRPST
jgi:DNA-binding MarR family transcriptional regulator